MTSLSPCLAVDEYCLSSLCNLLRHRSTCFPSAMNAVFDSFLAKTQCLQHHENHKRVSGFEREYMKLCASIDQAPGYKTSLTLQTRKTRVKNRYQDVLPIDKTRVKLQNTVEDNDYINANYIDGGYIACSAPVPVAMRDFWHMVWQCNVHVILMLTNFIERKRVKADLYWDTCLKKAVEFGGIRVILLEEEEEESSSLRVGYIMRRFQICQVNDKGQEGESRVIRHLQLTTWPDHGAIRDFQVIAPILDAMNRYRCEASRMYHGVETRVIVHCSAGIGRSGTFIAIDILYRQLHQVLTDKSDNVEEKTRALQHAMNIPRVVYHLRSQRPGMVQTPEQYEMIYQHVAAVISGSQSW